MSNVSKYVSGLLFFGILACLFIPVFAESISFGYYPDLIQFTETGNSYILNNSELEIEFFKGTLGYNQYRNARNDSVLIYNARVWVDYLGPGDKWKPAGIAQTTSYRQIYRGYEVTRHYKGIQADYDVVYTWVENRPIKYTVHITAGVEDDFQVAWSLDGVVGISKIEKKSIYAGNNYNLVISIQDVIRSFGNDSVDVTETISANGKKFDYTFGSWELNFSDVANNSHKIQVDPSIDFNGSNLWADTSGTMIIMGNNSLRNDDEVDDYIIQYDYTEGTGTVGYNLNRTPDKSLDWTMVGTPTWESGGGINFTSNASEYVKYEQNTTWTKPTSNFTFYWDFLPEATHQGGFGGLIYDAMGGSGRILLKDDNTLLHDMDFLPNLYSTNTIPDNTRQTMLYFYNGSTQQTENTTSIIFTNDTTASKAISTLPTRLFTGHTTTYGFNGIGYNFKYWKRTLSPAERQSVLNGEYKSSQYREIDNARDAGANHVHKYVEVLGIDPSVNTSLSLWVNGSNSDPTGGTSWEQVNASFNAGDNVTIGLAYEYRYARFKVYSNTTYQPETNIISNITITSDSKTITAPIVTLLSMTPSEICQNYTGNLSILYGISHSSAGLNNTSISFIYRNYDYDCACSNHSIRPPDNNLATLWDLDGRILRAANRNESLNFENNATITGGDDYTWSGLDENNSRLTIVPVNSTYTKVYINGTIHDVMPQMWYLDRTDLQEAPKTSIGVHKFNNVLIKFWNFEIFQGNTDFLGVGYTDTYLNPNPIFQPLDANPVNFYYVNSSYDPATGGDPLTSGYAVYMGSLNASGWIDHVYSPHINSNYVRGFIDNNILETYLNTTNISYLYFTSNTPSSKPYYINMTNVASSTNVSFANTNVLWAGNTPPYAAQAYTPNIWFAFMKLNISLDQKLYVADNNDQWSNSTMNRTNISSGLFPPTKPSFYSFHNGFIDYDMNGTYHDTIQIQVSASSDPDGGSVTHNITLHYGNDTYVATINGSAVAEDGVYTNVTFNTTLYYSQTENYTLRVVATDDESETATTWLGVNFSLDGSPRIISYSPGTPIYSREGENQTFSITTNILGNVTWYIDSVEVFNETLVTYSSYSNSTASLGYHNVTVITTNINGTNSMTWDWTVRTRLWSLVVDSVAWGISVAQYLVSNIGIVITTAFSLICILILMMLIGAALSVTNIIFR